MRPVQVVILAAGKGTRMRSALPKVAHAICGRPMLEHVVRAAADALSDPDQPEDPPGDEALPRYGVVLGHGADRVRQALTWTPPATPISFVVQAAQRGTGDAVRCARPALADGETAPATVLVLYGDTPLLRAETLRALLDAHERERATLTFLTALADRPTDYGRVLRDDAGDILGIVEARHATPAQLALPEVNSGIYCFDAAWLWSRLDALTPHPNGELYLTDLVDRAVAEGRAVASVTADLDETLGVNDRVMLAEAERILHDRILRELMLGGVTIQDPTSTYVECGVRVGHDTILRPGTWLRGATIIGQRCEIGPHSVIRDSQIGDDCVVLASWVEEATMEPRAQLGPMSHLRPGARLMAGVKLGNYAEVKNATLGPEVQMHHFSYIGDATVGARTNIAAGSITANFKPDGTKARTTIGQAAFIGCDTILIAPVTVGDGAMTGAGAVVTHDVAASGVAVGMPARVIKHRPPATATTSPADPAAATSPATSGAPPAGASEEEPRRHGE